MPDPQIITTLSTKRDEIIRVISAYEIKITEAKRDLAHINATLQLFKVNGETPQFPVHMGVARMFKRRELFDLCSEALRDAPNGLDTRELAIAIIRAKGLDEFDKVLRKAIGYVIVQTLTGHWRRGKIGSDGKRKGVRLWFAKSESINIMCGILSH